MSEKREILHNAFVIKKAYDSMWEKISDKFDLTRAEIDVLAFLANNPGLDTASSVVEYRMIAKSHVSKAVENLIKRGFIVSEKDSRDRRLVHLTLTENSENAVDDIKRRQNEFIEIINKGISDEERRIFIEISEKISDNAFTLIDEKI